MLKDVVESLLSLGEQLRIGSSAKTSTVRNGRLYDSRELMHLGEEEAKRIARTIAFGHAYWKHATDVSESGELIGESSFESPILETLLHPSKTMGLERGRVAYWNAVEGLLVLFDPRYRFRNGLLA